MEEIAEGSDEVTDSRNVQEVSECGAWGYGLEVIMVVPGWMLD